MPADFTAITEDTALDGRLRLRQPRKGHRFGHDAILLAAATPARSGDRVVEFGAGIGAAGLAVLTRVPGIELTMAEIEPGLAALAAENIALNGLGTYARSVTLDVTASARDFADLGLSANCADQVLMNPPFNEATHQASPDPLRRRAHMAPENVLSVWVGAARRLLREGGCLTLIWRANGLFDVLAALQPGFGGIALCPVYPQPGKPAIRVICRAVKGSHSPLSLRCALTLNDDMQRPTAAAEAILRAGAALMEQA